MNQVSNEGETSMLRAEVEMLMGERQQLLRTVGAAAAFVARLDSNLLSQCSSVAADLLSQSLNGISEETLQEALELVEPELAPPAAGC